jgi:hypothetical protein
MLLWVSFADPHKPKGETFLGAVVVPVGNLRTGLPTALDVAISALGAAYHLCVCIEATTVPDESIPLDCRNRVLSRVELIERDLVNI